MQDSMLNDLIFDPAYIIIGLGAMTALLFLLVIICLVKLGGLKKRYRKFMEDGNAQSLEALIQSQVADIKVLKEEDVKNKEHMEQMGQVLSGCYQKTGVVKYDALTGMGGHVSFALALLDRNNSGIMINSIHTREGSYLYMKNIQNGTCDLQLGKEESEALDQAMKAK